MGKVSLLDSAPRRRVVALTSSAVLLLGTPLCNFFFLNAHEHVFL
jgi:hypothetical protein